MSDKLSDAELISYQRDGYVLVPRLFDAEEIALLRDKAKQDRALDEQSYGRSDGEGGSVRLSLWNHPSDDLYGMFSRNARVVDRVEQLLGDEPYHYHSKMIMKEARTGGAWAWHQDYGYWYDNGVLFPNLCSVFIAVDPATRANGCLQVLQRSHDMGRINHVKTGEQTGADPERVAAASERLELVYVEMEPGDALFFHPNLLHRSDQNRSAADRWALVCCYNARCNDPYKEGRHPRYTPLKRVPNDSIHSSMRP
jgi:ectoine hydroxylase